MPDDKINDETNEELADSLRIAELNTAISPPDDFDFPEWEDLGDVDMSTYDQRDNENSMCEGGGCTI